MKKIIASVCILLMTVFCSISAYAYTAAEVADMLTFSEISFEEKTAVTYDLAFIRKFKGFDIEWSVTEGTDVVSDTGAITRPGVGEMPKNATITATISLEGDTAQKSFEVTVLPYENESEILEKVKYELTFDRLSGESIETVSSDLTLPSTLGYGTHIIWSSSDNAILRIIPDGTDYKGIVSNAYFTDGIHSVFLTATIYLGDSFAQKQFYIRTKEQTFSHTYTATLSGVAEKFDKLFLQNNNVLAIREDLVLPEIDGATITYTTTDPSVITTEGKVTRSVDSDEVVSFRVTFNNGFENTHKIYSLIVKAAGDEDIATLIEEDLKWAVETLKASNSLGSVTTNLSLPTSGPNGTRIEWSSSNTAALANDGKVTRQSADTTLTLSVKVYFAEESRQDSVNITVKALPSTVTGGIPTDGTSNGGGTAGLSPGGYDTPAATSTRYTDVPMTHWAYNAIEYLTEEKIIDGMGDGIYNPNGLITREAFTKVLITAMDTPTEMYNAPFVDIDESHWAYPYVSTGSAIGIIKGIEDDVFGTGMSITRQDICTLIYRAYFPVETARNDTDFCNDYSNISDYAKTAVSVMYENGLLQGDDNGNFNPQNPATRAEVAMIFYRLLNK